MMVFFKERNVFVYLIKMDISAAIGEAGYLLPPVPVAVPVGVPVAVAVASPHGTLVYCVTPFEGEAAAVEGGLAGVEPARVAVPVQTDTVVISGTRVLAQLSRVLQEKIFINV